MSITTWNRIEPDPTQQSLEEGVAARVYDPLWLVARQWQLGELRGSNGGSPIRVDVSRQLSPIVAVRRGTESVPFAADGPALESLVELEAVVQGGDVRLRARGGQYFLDLLVAHNLTSYAARASTDLSFVGDEDELAAPLVSRLRGRLPDAARLHDELSNQPPTLSQRLGVSVAHGPAFAEVTGAWLEWYQQRAGFVRGNTWVAERMEYAFQLEIAGPDGTHLLEAPDFDGGHLDWDAFRRHRPSAPSSPAGRPPTTTVHVPTLVKFPGSPARRFWQLEDSQIDLAAIEAGPGDVGRVILVEFALLWGNDWFAVPIPTPTGGLLTISSLVATDTFGVPTAIRSYSDVAPDPAFQLFRLTSDATDGMQDALFIAPGPTGTAVSSPVEEVALVRDEGGNVAWGVERVVPTSVGRPSVAARPVLNPTPSASGQQSKLEYLPMTRVIEGWFPLVPTRRQDGARMLTRAEFVVDENKTHTAPRGVVLSGLFAIVDAELPREGVVIRRRWKVARTQTGRLQLWSVRERQPAAGEVASGLIFDAVRAAPAE